MADIFKERFVFMKFSFSFWWHTNTVKEYRACLAQAVNFGICFAFIFILDRLNKKNT